MGWRLLLAAWIAYAGFQQGGGWAQNARFALVRALVEQGRLPIDDYLVYVGAGERSGAPQLARLEIDDAAFHVGEREYALAWSGSGTPLRGDAAGAELVRLDQVAATGDVSYARGHLHPNKAPGTSLLAVPAYFLLYRLERALGLDADAWWVLTVNVWLTTAASVALVAAIGVGLFFALALHLAGGRLVPAAWASVAFAFGTPFFPYATLLFDNDVVATGLLAAVFLGLRASQTERRSHLVLAGVAAGGASLSSYLAVLALPLLALDLLWRDGIRAWPWFALGLAGPLALLGAYHWACFGTPFVTPYQLEDPLFQEHGALLGVLGAPHLEALAGVLISPYRGLFFGAPVLLLGVAGLWQMARMPERRREAALFAGLALAFLLFNVCFNGWHAGWGVGPRYLVPALPFLALPLVFAFERAFRPALVLAAVSIFSMTAFTVVDPQSPVGTSSIAERPGRPRLLREPLSEYVLPLFVTGRAAPILAAQIAAGLPERERVLELFRGPVSANPIGVYEGWVGRVFPPPAEQLRWNSFNAGELLLPESRLSPLLPLLPAACLVASALAIAYREDQGARTEAPERGVSRSRLRDRIP